MKAPAMQFYAKDWLENLKLKRCSDGARGAWINIMAVLHLSDEYGVARMPLAELVKVASVKPMNARELVDKGVLKGSDSSSNRFEFTPKHAGKRLAPVTLLDATNAPLWFSSRMVRDEYIRQRRGAGYRFKTGEANPHSPNQSPIQSPKPPIGGQSGDGPAVAVAVSNTNTVSSNEQRPVDKSARQRRNEARAQTQLAAQAQAEQQRAQPPGGSVADFVKQATGKTPRKANGAEDPGEPHEPTAKPAQRFKLGDDLPQDWRESADGIDHAGQSLGMLRIPFEADQDYAQRIEARIALDRGGST